MKARNACFGLATALASIPGALGSAGSDSNLRRVSPVHPGRMIAIAWTPATWGGLPLAEALGVLALRKAEDIHVGAVSIEGMPPRAQ